MIIEQNGRLMIALGGYDLNDLGQMQQAVIGLIASSAGADNLSADKEAVYWAALLLNEMILSPGQLEETNSKILTQPKERRNTHN
jgi:hypothetical protein